ncbi:MAG: hypothetical protein V9G19_27895 [Tetrasphaera sp.]
MRFQIHTAARGSTPFGCARAHVFERVHEAAAPAVGGREAGGGGGRERAVRDGLREQGGEVLGALRAAVVQGAQHRPLAGEEVAVGEGAHDLEHHPLGDARVASPEEDIAPFALRDAALDDEAHALHGHARSPWKHGRIDGFDGGLRAPLLGVDEQRALAVGAHVHAADGELFGEPRAAVGALEYGDHGGVSLPMWAAKVMGRVGRTGQVR